MPLGVQGHHALMDGFHVGKYFQYHERSKQEPDTCMASNDEPAITAHIGGDFRWSLPHFR